MEFKLIKSVSISIGVLFFFGFAPIKQINKPRPWIAPSYTDSLINPFQSNAELLQKGKSLYHAHCIVCHGVMGKGDGDSGFGLEMEPGDLTGKSSSEEKDGAIYWKIETGRSSMPSFSDRLSSNQIWYLVLYIRDLQANNLVPKKQKKEKSH
ncbi:MAG: c-type cytochrome [Bacteroidia bacterium]|nr:c-type cytochrome [Bacteroidia bacterium]MCF8425842.1 c-type cytochrome [Bacteroidia bacterium]MCF8447422.1 c-type cytochrome [Bacteroidia bacterium]